jgi:DNA polymerase/3'-5' exonuclease PolX
VKPPTNDDVAAYLDRLADVLEEEAAPRERVRAWQKAAESVRSLGWSVAEVLTFGGAAALAGLPGIGEGLAQVIQAIVHTAEERLALAS